MPLANIERLFVAHLLQPQSDDGEFINKLGPLKTLTVEKQLEIYRSNINGAHQKVLGQIYPACLNILGNDYFNHISQDYRFQYPSVNPDLNVYGESFPLFLQKKITLHTELSDYDYLAELALLEWHWHASYYAKNDTVFDFYKLAAVNPDEQDKLCFILSDSFFLHRTWFPLLELWQANQNANDGKQEFVMPDSENYFCLSRFNLQPDMTRITQYQFELLNAITENFSLSALIDINGDTDDAEGFQQQLIYFIEKGWVIGFSLLSDTK